MCDCLFLFVCILLCLLSIFSCRLSLSHWLLCSVFVGLLVGFVSSFIGVLSLCCVCARVVTLLTFDDGPDSRWTPSVLHTLKKYHVHAAFFL